MTKIEATLEKKNFPNKREAKKKKIRKLIH